MAKRGRKVGGVSFCKVTLAELNRVLKPTAHVMVSVKYAALVGLAGSTMKSEVSSISSAVQSNACEILVEDFNDEDEDHDGFPPVHGEGVASAPVIDQADFLKPVITVENFN